MNENNIVSIDAVIDRIKICGYIDCNEHDGYYDEYEYDNILYYLKKYKNLQSKIDKLDNENFELAKRINNTKKIVNKVKKVSDYMNGIACNDLLNTLEGK